MINSDDDKDTTVDHEDPEHVAAVNVEVHDILQGLAQHVARPDAACPMCVTDGLILSLITTRAINTPFGGIDDLGEYLGSVGSIINARLSGDEDIKAIKPKLPH